MAAVFDYKSWIGRSNDWQPKAMIAFHAVAVNTNLQENEGKKVSSLQLSCSCIRYLKNLGKLKPQISYFVLSNITGKCRNSILHLCFVYAWILKFFGSVPIGFPYTITVFKIYSFFPPKHAGLHVKYHAMRAGTDGEVVSIRISQQLLWFVSILSFRGAGVG